MLLLKFLACPAFSLSMRFFLWQCILLRGHSGYILGQIHLHIK